MIGNLIVSLLFFWIPIGLFTFFGISIYRYAVAKKENKKNPEAFSSSEITSRKILLIISSVLAGVFIAVVIGLIILIFSAVRFM